MTAERFRACLAVINWSQHDLARLLGVDAREIRRWASGAHGVPERIAVWLEKLAQCHEANPPPDRR